MKILNLISSKLFATLTTVPPVAQAGTAIRVHSVSEGEYIMTEKIEKSDADWRMRLTPEQYHILREEGTERAFSGKYDKNYDSGTYLCAGCGLDLFSSNAKFNSGTGWPSFFKPVAPENVATEDDSSFFLHRIEVHCTRCGGHLGHVFEDGPKPTGRRFCINSAALTFVADK